MAPRPLVVVIICLGLFLIFQDLIPKAMALKRTSNYGDYLMEDQRTRRRKNAIVQRTRNQNVLENLDNVGVIYDAEPFDPGRTIEELPDFMLDYANMIRNDYILLDKSVETRTRKRGNIKLEKHNKTLTFLGDDAYPQYVETRNCNEQKICKAPYVCQASQYNLTVLRRKPSPDAVSSLWLPANLKLNWIAEFVPVNVGCVCTNNFYTPN